jgi:hypothetical protein
MLFNQSGRGRVEIVYLQVHFFPKPIPHPPCAFIRIRSLGACDALRGFRTARKYLSLIGRILPFLHRASSLVEPITPAQPSIRASLNCLSKFSHEYKNKRTILRQATPSLGAAWQNIFDIQRFLCVNFTPSHCGTLCCGTRLPSRISLLSRWYTPSKRDALLLSTFQ